MLSQNDEGDLEEYLIYEVCAHDSLAKARVLDPGVVTVESDGTICHKYEGDQ